MQKEMSFSPYRMSIVDDSADSLSFSRSQYSMDIYANNHHLDFPQQ